MNRTMRLRRRLAISAASKRRRRRSGDLLRRQDQQKAPVLVVPRKDVGDSLGGQIALGIYRNPLAEGAHAPLEGGLDRVGVAVLVGVGGLTAVAVVDPLEAQDLLHR